MSVTIHTSGDAWPMTEGDYRNDPRPSVCVSFRPSVILSVLPSVRSCPYNSSYLFHRIDLKIYRLPSYRMNMCMRFLIFVSAIFDKVMALADSYLVPATPAIFFIK